MSSEEERLLQICKNVTEEKDSEKLAHLIRELNQELEHRRTKRQSGSEHPEPNAKRASYG